MINITKEQAQGRYALLSPTLQDAIFSEQNTEIISAIGEQYHLSDDRIEEVASLVGWVLLGFLHLEDLPKKIAEDVGVAPQLAKDITTSLTNKIFAIIKPDLDKTYAPVPPEHIPEKGTTAPKDLSAQPTPTPAPPLPPSLPKPTTLSDIGWSKQSTPLPSMSIRARVPMSRPDTSSPITPPKPPADPAPVMLHQDTSFKAPERNAGFTLSRPNGGAEMTMNPATAQAPARPAIVEFGKTPASTPTPPKVSPMGFRPSLSSMPTINTGPRNVSQVAAPTPPKPPTPPAPTMTVPIPRPPQAPMVPKPPMPPQPQPQPQPQPNKPIVKDFL